MHFIDFNIIQYNKIEILRISNHFFFRSFYEIIRLPSRKYTNLITRYYNIFYYDTKKKFVIYL